MSAHWGISKHGDGHGRAVSFGGAGTGPTATGKRRSETFNPEYPRSAILTLLTLNGNNVHTPAECALADGS
jgi:hypothetical protein